MPKLACGLDGLMDYFTKYLEVIPLPDQKADTIARAFVEQIIVRHQENCKEIRGQILLPPFLKNKMAPTKEVDQEQMNQEKPQAEETQIDKEHENVATGKEQLEEKSEDITMNSDKAKDEQMKVNAEKTAVIKNMIT
ncbi:hypothetical protein JTB14_002132 [Gonioctena quinquepunctata]|nr:hypothetical protein JTB14_002132 [Gonioctena quinquepunctata]